jgi:hypothetical protein
MITISQSNVQDQMNGSAVYHNAKLLLNSEKQVVDSQSFNYNRQQNYYKMKKRKERAYTFLYICISIGVWAVIMGAWIDYAFL